jgi:septal ring factor EnvC (AmiA/AmiB activator)
MLQSPLDAAGSRHHFAPSENVYPQITPAMRFSSSLRRPLPRALASAVARATARALALLLAVSVLAASACVNPRAEANTAAALNDAANEIGGLKSDLAALQGELDSLRTVVAKHDTTISNLANVAHVPIVK